MFKWFKKKNSKPEISEQFPTKDAEEILEAIQAIKNRSNIDKHQATFLNANISKKACRKLKRKGIKVEIFSSDNSPYFKVFW